MVIVRNRTRGWRHSYDRYPSYNQLLHSRSMHTRGAIQGQSGCASVPRGLYCISDLNERPPVQTVARDVNRDILSLHFPTRHKQILKWGKIMQRTVVLNDLWKVMNDRCKVQHNCDATCTKVFRTYDVANNASYILTQHYNDSILLYFVSFQRITNTVHKYIRYTKQHCK